MEEEEERVDEIECKVFIKRNDSNLLSICGELELRDGPCSEATTRRRKDCGICFEARRVADSQRCWTNFEQIIWGKREREKGTKRKGAISRHPDSAAGSSQSESNQKPLQ